MAPDWMENYLWNLHLKGSNHWKSWVGGDIPAHIEHISLPGQAVA